MFLTIYDQKSCRCFEEAETASPGGDEPGGFRDRVLGLPLLPLNRNAWPCWVVCAEANWARGQCQWDKTGL